MSLAVNAFVWPEYFATQSMNSSSSLWYFFDPKNKECSKRWAIPGYFSYELPALIVIETPETL